MKRKPDSITENKKKKAQELIELLTNTPLEIRKEIGTYFVWDMNEFIRLALKENESFLKMVNLEGGSKYYPPNIHWRMTISEYPSPNGSPLPSRFDKMEYLTIHNKVSDNCDIDIKTLQTLHTSLRHLRLWEEMPILHWYNFHEFQLETCTFGEVDGDSFESFPNTKRLEFIDSQLTLDRLEEVADKGIKSVYLRKCQIDYEGSPNLTGIDTIILDNCEFVRIEKDNHFHPRGTFNTILLFDDKGFPIDGKVRTSGVMKCIQNDRYVLSVLKPDDKLMKEKQSIWDDLDLRTMKVEDEINEKFGVVFNEIVLDGDFLVTNYKGWNKK